MPEKSAPARRILQISSQKLCSYSEYTLKCSQGVYAYTNHRAFKASFGAWFCVPKPSLIETSKSFTFTESTPSSEVANLVEEGFWTCNMKMSIDILSSRGVLPSSSVRVSTEDLGFVEGIPILPDAMVELGLVKRLRDYGVITEITISDIKTELEGKALDTPQLVSQTIWLSGGGLFLTLTFLQARFLEWIGYKARTKYYDNQTVRSLLGVAVANDEDDHHGRVLILSEMKSFLNVSRIPAEMPVPPNTMPFKFTKKMSKVDLEALGWEDLQIVPWVRWLVENIGGGGDLSSDQDLAHSHSFARAILPVISKQWDGLSQSSKATITELLGPRTTMPTKLGMRKPTESYFPSVNLFDDLPVVVSMHGVKEKLLAALGVSGGHMIYSYFSLANLVKGAKDYRYWCRLRATHDDVIYQSTAKERITTAMESCRSHQVPCLCT